MPTRKAPAAVNPTTDDVEGMTAETAVRVMTTTPPETDPNPELEMQDEEAGLAARMRALVAQTGSDRVVVKLFRPARNGGRGYEWCADYAPQELEERDLELIRSQWGPGAYELRVIGSRGILTRIQVNIAAPAPMSQSAQQTGTSELAQILRSMQEQQNALLEAITRRPDPRAEMIQQLEMLRMMRDAFAPATPAAPAVDQVSMIRGIADAVKSLREVSREVLPPDDDAPPDMMTMLAKGLDTMRALSSQGSAQAVPALPAPQIPNSFSEQGDDPMLLALRSHLIKLTGFAASGKPATVGGEYIYSELPDELLPVMEHASWFDSCVQLYPPIRAHEAWARDAHAHALVLFRAAASTPAPPPAG